MSDEQMRAEFEIVMGVLWPGTSLSRLGEDGYSDVLTDRCWALHKHSWQAARQQREKDADKNYIIAKHVKSLLDAYRIDGNDKAVTFNFTTQYGANIAYFDLRALDTAITKFTPKERTDV